MNVLDETITAITEKLQSEQNIKATFGQPIELESMKIIPVAKLDITIDGEGSGGGSGRGGNSQNDKKNMADAIADTVSGGGAGQGFGKGNVHIEMKPIGFIYQKGDTAEFVQIS